MLKNAMFKMGKYVAALAMLVTIWNVNAACIWINHQSEMPDGSKKLRKF